MMSIAHETASSPSEEVARIEAEISSGWDPSPRARLIEPFVVAILVLVLVANLVLIFASTILRYWFDTAIPSGGAVSNLLLASLVFLGSAVAFHQGEHRSLRLLLDVLPRSVAGWLDSCTIASVAFFGAALAVSAYQWSEVAAGDIPGTSIPAWVECVPIFAGALLLVLYCSLLLIDRGWKSAAGGLAGPATIALVVLGTRSAYPELDQLETAFFVYLGVLLLLLLLGVPVAFCFGIVTICLVLTTHGQIALNGISRRMTDTASDFILTAVPLFIAAGFLMEAGDITRRIIGVARSFLGHVRGGMGHVTVGSMYFMSGVTGSEAADVAAVGTVMRRSLRDSGWSRAESTGILIASSVMGATVPPSIGLIVIGSATGLSVGVLFMGGFLPAAFLALVLLAFVYVRARMQGIRGEARVPWPDRAKAVQASLFALGLPAIIVCGMVTGFATPTELSAVSVFYVLLVELVIYRRLRISQLAIVAKATAVMSGMILFIVSAASGLVYVGTYAGVPQALGESLLNAARGSAVLLLLLTVLALIPLGMLMEGLPALLIFPPLFIPAGMELGVNPYHYAVLMFIAVYLGANLPPLGAAYYFAASVMQVSVKNGMPMALLYLGIVALGLVGLIFLPNLVLFLPEQFGMLE